MLVSYYQISQTLVFAISRKKKIKIDSEKHFRFNRDKLRRKSVLKLYIFYSDVFQCANSFLQEIIYHWQIGPKEVSEL